MCVENHIHICYIMLYHFQMNWNPAQSSLSFLVKEQSATSKFEDDSRTSNRAIQTSQTAKEEIDREIWTTKHFGTVLAEDFNVCTD